MEIVNNQYKIVREIHYTVKNILNFVVLDFHNKNHALGLSIVRPASLSVFSEEFIKKHFKHIAVMQNDLFFKNYDFGITSLENDGNTEKVYYYTYELHEEYVPLDEFIDPFNLDEILNTVIQICRCENMGIINGYIHPIDSIDDFFAIADENSFTVKANDLVTLAINKKDFSAEYRFENIAALFLSLLDGYMKSRNVYENIQAIREAYKEHFLTDYENKILECILTVCENICLGKYSSIIYDFYYQVISDINAKLNSFFSVDANNVYSYVCTRPRIANQEKHIKRIIKEITGPQLPDSHNVFLVTGNLGCGKTPFLHNLNFLLKFEDVDAYFVSVEKKSDQFFLKLLSQILDTYPQLKNEVDLNTIYLQVKEFASEKNYYSESTYSVVGKINNVIKKASYIKPQVIIADNLNYADKFILEFIFSNIAQGLNMQRTFFVFSFSKDFVNLERYFKTAYDGMIKLHNCKEIRLKPLTEYETALLIQDMLVMRTEPVIIAKEINKITGGNLYFIITLIKQLLENGELLKNRFKGYWEMNPKVYNIAHFFDIPASVISLTKSTFSRYFTEHAQSIKRIAVFQLYIKRSFAEKLLPEVSKEEIDSIFHDFIENNFISEIKPGVYHIDEKMLQTTFYNSLSDEEKRDLHIRALAILKEENDDIFYDEILIHYDYLGAENEVLDLLITKARENNLRCDYHNAIINYERAWIILDNHALDAQVDIGIELASVYSGLGKIGLALVTFGQLEEFIDEVQNKKIVLKYYFHYCDILYEIVDIKNFQEKAEKLNELIQSFSHLDSEEMNHIDRIYILQDIIANNRQTAMKKLLSLISRIEKNGGDKKSLSILYRYAGNLELLNNSYADAYKFFKLSYKNAEEHNDIKSMLNSLNNIASTYLLYRNDAQLAEKTYLEALEIATLAGFEQNILGCYANLIMLYFETGQLDLAEYYLTLAAEKLILINFSVKNLHFYIQLLNYELLIKRNNYVKALTTKNNFLSSVKNYSMEVLQEEANINFYSLNGHINLVFGEYDECLENLKLARNSCSDVEQKKILNFIMELVTVLKTGQSHQAKLKKTLLSTIKTLSPHAKYNFLSQVIWLVSISIASQQFYLLNEFALSVIENCGTLFDKNTLVDIRIKLIKTVLDESNAEIYITEALAKLKEQKTPMLEIMVKQQLALNYFKKRKYAHGTFTFINVEKLIIEFMEQIPNEKRLTFFNLYAFKVPFEIVYNFIRKGETKICESVFQEKVSQIGLKRLLNSNDLNLAVRSRDFLEILLGEVFYANDEVLKYQTLLETIQNFCDDYESNIRLVLNLLIQKMFANYVNIVVTDSDGSQRLMFPANGSILKFSDYAAALKENGFARIREIGDLYNFELITIPLADEKCQTDKTYTLMFCIEKDIVILSERQIGYCKKLIPILNSLLSSYELNNIVIMDSDSGAVHIRHFEKTLKSAVNYFSQDYNEMSVGYFRIENIKAIDYLFGQRLADKIVKSIISMVNANIEPNDMVCRYTRDEFAILFFDENKNTAIKKIETIKEQSALLKFDDVELPIVLTFGIASLNDEGVSPDNIVDSAHTAMIYASGLGVNKTSLYFPLLENTIMDRTAFSSLYSNTGNLSFDKINCIFELLFMTSNYASKTAMIQTFLNKILYFIRCETVSLIYTQLSNDDYMMQQFIKQMITVRSDDVVTDVEVNTKFIKRAIESGTGFFTDEVIVHNAGELNFPTWQSVLACPIINNDKLKGLFYLTMRSREKSFSTEDLGFVSVAAVLLGKEL